MMLCAGKHLIPGPRRTGAEPPLRVRVSVFSASAVPFQTRSVILRDPFTGPIAVADHALGFRRAFLRRLEVPFKRLCSVAPKIQAVKVAVAEGDLRANIPCLGQIAQLGQGQSLEFRFCQFVVLATRQQSQAQAQNLKRESLGNPDAHNIFGWFRQLDE